MKSTCIEHTDEFLSIYLNDYNRIAEHYSYDFKNPATIRQRLQDIKVQGDLAVFRKSAEILEKFNRHLGCSENTLVSLRKLASGDAIAVVTGQQTGIMTGPLYTIYKIVSAVLTAQKISHDHNVPAVPIFWAASEDHDFAEIAPLNVYDPSSHVIDWVLKNPLHGRVSIGHIPLDERAEDSIRFFADTAKDCPAKKDILHLLTRTYHASRSISEWCSMLVTELFQDYGLIVVDSMDPELRRLSVSVFQDALLNADRIYDSIESMTKRLSEKGLKTQLAVDRSVLPFFHNTQQGRFQIHRLPNDQYQVDELDGRSFAQNELMEMIQLHPEQFSPNVVLRPIIQDHLFPTAVYVAGPGELAYYAQLKEVYPIFHKKMPVIQPRISATIITPDIHDGIEALNISIPHMMTVPDHEMKRLLEDKEPFSITARFESVRKDIKEQYKDLIEDLTIIDTDLDKISQGNLGRIMFQLDYLEKKAWQKLRKKEKEMVQSFHTIREFLHPRGKLQERIINVFSLLCMVETDLIQQMMKLDPYAVDCHYIMDLGDDDHR